MPLSQNTFKKLGHIAKCSWTIYNSCEKKVQIYAYLENTLQDELFGQHCRGKNIQDY